MAPPFDQFAKMLATRFEVEAPISAASTLVEDLDFDSLRLLELWVAIETVSDRFLEPEVIASLRTAGDVHNLLSQLLDERAGLSADTA